jgi:hypothetical protein
MTRAIILIAVTAAALLFSTSIATSAAPATTPASDPVAADQYSTTALASGQVAAEQDLTGFRASVYYTPVESYHPRSCTRTVVAWPDISTVGSKVTVGPYPCRFVNRVKEEGTGRITSGNYAGRYLNFSWEGLGPRGDRQGFWLDTAPRDSYGNTLVPFVTAAADANVLPRGTPFKVIDCGRQDGASPPDAEVCAQFKAANWKIEDQFTTGFGGEKHIDLYIGEEDQPSFEGRSPKYVDLTDVVLRAYY